MTAPTASRDASTASTRRRRRPAASPRTRRLAASTTEPASDDPMRSAAAAIRCALSVRSRASASAHAKTAASTKQDVRPACCWLRVRLTYPTARCSTQAMSPAHSSWRSARVGWSRRAVCSTTTDPLRTTMSKQRPDSTSCRAATLTAIPVTAHRADRLRPAARRLPVSRLRALSAWACESAVAREKDVQRGSGACARRTLTDARGAVVTRSFFFF